MRASITLPVLSLLSLPCQALPTHLTSTIAPLTQSCAAISSKSPGWAYYSAYVGVVFDNGSGCEDIENEIEGLIGPAPTGLCGEADTLSWFPGESSRGYKSACSYKCLSADGGASTTLEFEVPANHGQHVNQALNAMYPMVKGGFDCPSMKG